MAASSARPHPLPDFSPPPSWGFLGSPTKSTMWTKSHISGSGQERGVRTRALNKAATCVMLFAVHRSPLHFHIHQQQSWPEGHSWGEGEGWRARPLLSASPSSLWTHRLPPGHSVCSHWGRRCVPSHWELWFGRRFLETSIARLEPHPGTAEGRAGVGQGKRPFTPLSGHRGSGV